MTEEKHGNVMKKHAIDDHSKQLRSGSMRFQNYQFEL